LMTDDFKVGRGQFATEEDKSMVQPLDPSKPFPKFRTPKATKITAALEAAAALRVAASQENPSEEATMHSANVIALKQPDSKYNPAIVIGMTEETTLVPEANPAFVPFGNYADVHRIIKSRIFYPV